MTFEEFLSKKDEGITECKKLIKNLKLEYSENYLKQNNYNICEKILKVVKIECETLIALLQEKQEILSNLKYDNYHTIIEAFEEKEEQIYRQFCILRKIVYEANSKTLELQSKSEELFFNIKYRQNNKNFTQIIKDKIKWFVRHYNISLIIFLTMGFFTSCAYFSYIGYFPRLSDMNSILYYLLIVSIVATFIPFLFSILFILPIFLINEIFQKIERVKGTELWYFIGILLAQLLLLTALPFIPISPVILILLDLVILPLLFFLSQFLFCAFCFKSGSYKDNVAVYVGLSLLGFCIFILLLFAVFIPFHTNAIRDFDSIATLSAGLIFVFICTIAFLVQEQINPIKASVLVFVITFLYFSFFLFQNVFKIIYLGNYKLEFLTLDIQAKDFINKNCLKQIKQGDTSDTIVVSDVKVLLNIGEEYRLQMQCDGKNVDFSIPSRFVKDNKEKIKNE